MNVYNPRAQNLGSSENIRFHSHKTLSYLGSQNCPLNYLNCDKCVCHNIRFVFKTGTNTVLKYHSSRIL